MDFSVVDSQIDVVICGEIAKFLDNSCHLDGHRMFINVAHQYSSFSSV